MEKRATVERERGVAGHETVGREVVEHKGACHDGCREGRHAGVCFGTGNGDDDEDSPVVDGAIQVHDTFDTWIATAGGLLAVVALIDTGMSVAVQVEGALYNEIMDELMAVRVGDTERPRKRGPSLDKEQERGRSNEDGVAFAHAGEQFVHMFVDSG